MYTYQQRFKGGLHLPTQQFFPVNMSEEWMSLEKKQEVKGNRLTGLTTTRLKLPITKEAILINKYKQPSQIDKISVIFPSNHQTCQSLLELLQHPQDQLQDEKQHFFSAALGRKKKTLMNFT